MYFSDCWVRWGQSTNQNPSVSLVAKGTAKTLMSKIALPAETPARDPQNEDP